MKATAAILLASTFLIGGAYAQAPTKSAATAPANHASSPAAKHDAEPDQTVGKHIADLHAKLKITSAEETQWAVVGKAMRDNADELDKAMDKREAANGTAIDDLNAYGEIVQTHADGIKKLSAAFSPLYASMPADQKKLADEVFAQRAHEGKKPVASK